MANTPVVVWDDTLKDIADAIRAKSGTSATMKPGQMAAAIDAIPSGGGGDGITREVDANGVYGYPTQNFSFSLPSNVIDMGDHALQYAFEACASLTSVNLSSLTAASGIYALYYAFYNCNNLTSVNLSSLTTVGDHAFYSAFRGCTSLASVSFPALTTVSAGSALYNAFYGCTSLASVSFPALTTVSAGNTLNSAFRDCTSLTAVSFPALATLSGAYAFNYAFSGCTSLTSLSFPALTTSSFGTPTSQFNNMLSGVTGCTVHFPAAIQSTIGSWTSVTNGFSGTNTTVLFDL